MNIGPSTTQISKDIFGMARDRQAGGPNLVSLEGLTPPSPVHNAESHSLRNRVQQLEGGLNIRSNSVLWES
jgi:hypothetical protein